MTLLLSSQGPAEDIFSGCFGLYTQTSTSSGSPVYQQLHTVTLEDGALLHYSRNRNGWIVSWEFQDEDEENIFFINKAGDASVVPTYGWKVYDGGSSKSEPTMTATPLNLTKDICSSIKISATGRAAKQCRDYMGTFTPVPGEYSDGRQVFRMGTFTPVPGKYSDGRQVFSVSGKYLLFDADFDSWIVSNSRQLGDERPALFSACAPGICPADPRARYWMYDDSGNFVKSENITVSCDKHFPSALQDVDDLVSYIEGKTSLELTSKPNKRTKKKPKGPKSMSAKEQEILPTPGPDIDRSIDHLDESGGQERTNSRLDALGAVGGAICDTIDNFNSSEIGEDTGSKVQHRIVADQITKNAMVEVEKKLKELKDLEEEKEEIEAMMRSNEVNSQKYFVKKEGVIKQRKEKMDDFRMNIYKKKEEKKKKELEIETLMKACDAIENDLKILEKGKSKLEKLTEEQNEEFNIEEKVIEMKKINLLDALQKNARATEKLTKFEGNNNSGSRGADDGRAVEILKRSIARKEKSIQGKEKSIQGKEEDLQCPVCLETVAAPVFMCRNQHIICSRSSCSANKVSKCPLCMVELSRPLGRHRYAEKQLEELLSMREELLSIREELRELTEELTELQEEEAN